VTDLTLVPIWLAVLVAGVVGCVIVRAAGLASTYVRDLLHVGAGVWVVGWPWWDHATAPIAIVAGVAVATALVPVAARFSRSVDRFRRSVASGDERFGGLIWYTLSYATLTAIGMTGDPFPAAAGLLALSLGDGLGGAVGRRFGTYRYRAPHGKAKSFEGTLTVFAAATGGVVAAAAITGADLAPAVALSLGATAALAEAAAPRGSDNALVPAAVFAMAHLLT
jgi:dolichol kinase